MDLRSAPRFLLLSAAMVCIPAAEPVVIHEWGTFTALHDEAGLPIGGINTDDEPLPKFVHDQAKMLLIGPSEVPPMFFKGAPSCHPDVTMRLETPVLYFHPSTSAAFTADVKVAFTGGWLTQYYPVAACENPGLDPHGWPHFGTLNSSTLGTLVWTGLAVGGQEPGPQTEAHVWLAPRQAQASALTTTSGEHEKFLFYRGVAHLEAPLSVARSADGGQLAIHANLGAGTPPLDIAKAWLVDIHKDGSAAFRMLPDLALTADRAATVITTPALFNVGDYGDIAQLRESVRIALVADGLYADEAQALLETWELSYFKSRGLRLFVLLPQAWTDHVLPLSVALSGGAKTRIQRTMVGRIELVSPEERRLLKVIATGPTSNGTWLQDFLDGSAAGGAGTPEARSAYAERWRMANTEVGGLARSGAPIPADNRAYLELGRFRNALLLDEAKRRPQPALAAFIGNYGLEAYSPRE
jgi:hypothetical protein